MVNLKVLLSSSVIAMALAQPAVAQDAPADPGAAPAEAAQSQRDSNEIIVVGTRIATNVQDVPIATTAVTSETLEKRQITTFANFGAIVPNATFCKSQGISGVSVTLDGERRHPVPVHRRCPSGHADAAPRLVLEQQGRVEHRIHPPRRTCDLNLQRAAHLPQRGARLRSRPRGDQPDGQGVLPAEDR